jgi:hypothetical protein
MSRKRRLNKRTTPRVLPFPQPKAPVPAQPKPLVWARTSPTQSQSEPLVILALGSRRVAVTWTVEELPPAAPTHAPTQAKTANATVMMPIKQGSA